MESLKDFLISPLGSIFNYFLRALIGSICICGGMQLFDFRNYSRFFTIRKIVGLFFISNWF
jgi:hypothetical protein